MDEWQEGTWFLIEGVLPGDRLFDLKSHMDAFEMLLVALPHIKTTWHYPHHMLHFLLINIENDRSVLDMEMYRFIGLYITFGSLLFKNARRRNLFTKEQSFIHYLVEKYEIEDTISPTRSITSSIVSFFPHYVAEHLHFGRGRIAGELRGLPRCLAFPGGIDLIPGSREWQPMIILWKMWRSSFTLGDILAKPSTEYLSIDYILLQNGIDFIVDLFGLKPVSVEQVIETIETAMEERSYFKYEGIYPARSFASVFCIYAEDICNYYLFNVLR